MVKSNTQKKFVKKHKPFQKNIPQEVVQVTDYIKRWTNRELAKIQQKDTSPVCTPTRDGYRIGQFRLKVYPNKTCDVLDHNLEFVHRFESKVSAILYTIYRIKNNHWQADQILQTSCEINKNYTDMLHFKHGVEQSLKIKDFVALDNKQARLEVAENKLQIYREKMLKIHRHAKLSKVWE